MLKKDEIVYIIENLNIKQNNTVLIHHPITDDIIKCIVKNVKNINVELEIPEDSDYYGQPNFEVKKYSILSILN